MKKIIMFLFALISVLSFSDAEDIIQQQNRLDNQRLRQQELENTVFDNNKVNIDNNAPDIKDDVQFLVVKINMLDKDNLLTPNEEYELLNKYLYKEIGSNKLSFLLQKITNKLISKGYITSTATISEGTDLSSGVLTLEIISGKIEDIVINKGNGLDKYKEFFMFVKNEGKVLNIRDLDTATENFNSISANNMNMEILPGDKPNTSKIIVTNELKDKYQVSLNTNNFGENNERGHWRYGVSFNVDSPLGIGDNFRFSYLTVHKKEPDRSWKISPNTLAPRQILPIGPQGYNPSIHGRLPYKRRMDMFSFGYTAKFRDYTLKLSSYKSIQENSIYAYNTVYDLKSSSQTLQAEIDKILYRDKKNKITLDFGIKRKQNDSHLESAILYDRNLSIGSTHLNLTTQLFKGILGISLGYERGLRIFNAEKDNGKLDTTPKAQFNKYTLNIGYYKPITQKLIYRLNVNGSYSEDVLYSSERQTLGGIGSVGGFNSETLEGDRAIEITNELAYNIPIKKVATISPYINYGYGAIKNNEDNSRYGTGYILGLTTGVRFSSKYIDFDFGYAKPLKYSEYLQPKNQEIYFSGSVKVSF